MYAFSFVFMLLIKIKGYVLIKLAFPHNLQTVKTLEDKGQVYIYPPPHAETPGGG